MQAKNCAANWTDKTFRCKLKMKSPARAVRVMRTWSEPCDLALQPLVHSSSMFVIFLVCMYIFNSHVLFLVGSNIFNLHVWPFWATNLPIPSSADTWKIVTNKVCQFFTLKLTFSARKVRILESIFSQN